MMYLHILAQIKPPALIYLKKLQLWGIGIIIALYVFPYFSSNLGITLS